MQLQHKPSLIYKSDFAFAGAINVLSKIQVCVVQQVEA